MFRMDWKNNLRSCGLAVAMAVAGAVVLMPAAPVLAQSAPQPRSLPDFTDLVDQVGPAVVNIRTLEHAHAGGRGGDQQMDEEMGPRRWVFDEPNGPKTYSEWLEGAEEMKRSGRPG